MTKKEKGDREVYSLDQINSKLKNMKDDQKKGFLHSLLANKDYKNIKKELTKLYSGFLLKTAVVEHKIIYDNFGEGVEPIYFWILDFMKDGAPGGLGLNISKGSEEYEASVSSGYFGEIGMRGTQMQQKSMEYMGAINQVIKSILNLIYDLKEFKLRIENYDDLKSKDPKIIRNALYTIKALWMDQVDVKKGRGSINMLAQQLDFVTLRDAFFLTNNEKEVNELDLNERVKQILIRKLYEFSHWKDLSEKDIRNRYNVEKKYLKSQVGSLKLYTQWLKPYLKAAQKLKIKDFNSPNIVNAFSNMQIDLTIYGNKEVKPGSIHPSYQDLKLERKYYYIIQSHIIFRSVPSTVTGQGGRHYIHGGRTEIEFKAFVMDDIELEVLQAQELYEDIALIDEWVGGTLEDLQSELAEFIEEKEEKVEGTKPAKDKQTMANPFEGVYGSFKDMLGLNFDKKTAKLKNTFEISEIKNKAEQEAKTICFLLFNLYKKAHGMVSV